MSGPLPHTKQVDKWAAEYLAEAQTQLTRAISKVKGTPDFREIYWTSLAADGIFQKISSSRWKPGAKTGRSIILRIPLLVAMGQISVAKVELRRLAELTAWIIYFTEHPVEWANFIESPTDGFYPNTDKPIRYCAHRGIKFYLDYASERLEPEPSGLGLEAIQNLRVEIGKLNSVVHPAHLSVTTGKIPPFEDNSGKLTADFSDTHKTILSNICIALAAIFTKKFDKLPPMYRANFDRMIGKELAKQIRKGLFGLHLT